MELAVIFAGTIVASVFLCLKQLRMLSKVVVMLRKDSSIRGLSERFLVE